MPDVETRILSALAQAAPYGLSGAELSKASGVGAGTLYPALHDMEATLRVTSAWEKPEPAAEPRRRLYWQGPRAGEILSSMEE